jgi:pyruvate formate lyase activating enzyme
MVDERTNCVCFFGGDPGPHSPHALKVAEVALERRPGTRICWETNGRWTPRMRERMVGTSLVSGGIVKVDLKAWHDGTYRALTGATRDATVETIERVTDLAPDRPEVPLLVVSTLLVPGYVDAEELRGISEFLASLDPVPPWSLLAFHPDFEMRDVPPSSLDQVREALSVAADAGLDLVHVGNVHIL